MSGVELKGMSWNHVRGHDSIVAASEAFHATQPDIRISWQTRSLQDFADYPIDKLAERFDFVLIDHPFAGAASALGCLLPLDDYLDAAFLADQDANSVGPSHRSYIYDGHQWALATDAASQVASYRPDLLQQIGAEPPSTWDEVFALAESRKGATGQVAIPLIPVDSLMTFCSLCAHFGEPAYASPEIVVSRPMGRHVLEMMRRLFATLHPASREMNPIRCYDRMSTTDEISYCPLAFGYSNYSQIGFRDRLLKFTNIPRASDGVPRGGILGGVGLAVSASTRHPHEAAAFAGFAASGEIQRGVYFDGGGQPGHRSAWLDDRVNAASMNFYRDTLDTLDNAYLRPRFNGFIPVQDESFLIVHAFLVEDQAIDAALDKLDAVYRAGRS